MQPNKVPTNSISMWINYNHNNHKSKCYETQL